LIQVQSAPQTISIGNNYANSINLNTSSAGNGASNVESHDTYTSQQNVVSTNRGVVTDGTSALTQDTNTQNAGKAASAVQKTAVGTTTVKATKGSKTKADTTQTVGGVQNVASGKNSAVQANNVAAAQTKTNSKKKKAETTGVTSSTVQGVSGSNKGGIVANTGAVTQAAAKTKKAKAVTTGASTTDAKLKSKGQVATAATSAGTAKKSKKKATSTSAATHEAAAVTNNIAQVGAAAVDQSGAVGDSAGAVSQAASAGEYVTDYAVNSQGGAASVNDANGWNGQSISTSVNEGALQSAGWTEGAQASGAEGQAVNRWAAVDSQAEGAAARDDGTVVSGADTAANADGDWSANTATDSESASDRHDAVYGAVAVGQAD